MTTREQQIYDALGTAIKAAEVATELATRLASRVSVNEAEQLLLTALGRIDLHISTLEAEHMRDAPLTEYGVVVAALAGRLCDTGDTP